MDWQAAFYKNNFTWFYFWYFGGSVNATLIWEVKLVIFAVQKSICWL
jgi:hypothetical protein